MSEENGHQFIISFSIQSNSSETFSRMAEENLALQTPGNSMATVVGPAQKAAKDVRTSDTPMEFNSFFKRKLSGAARRRYRKLRATNMSPDEALELCLKPLSMIPVEKRPPATTGIKRIHSEEGSFNEPLKKFPRLQSEGDIRPNIKVESDSLRVGIKNVIPMSQEQMKLVHRALNSSICRIETKGEGPKFLGLTHKPGWILITCENQQSRDWLEREINEMKPWPEAQLFTISEDELPKRTVATTFIYNSEAETIEEAVTLLRIQNQGLNTELWRILHSRKDSGGYLVTFSLDEASVDVLRQTELKANLGFKKIFFKVRGDTAHRSGVSSAEDVPGFSTHDGQTTRGARDSLDSLMHRSSASPAEGLPIFSGANHGRQTATMARDSFDFLMHRSSRSPSEDVPGFSGLTYGGRTAREMRDSFDFLMHHSGDNPAESLSNFSAQTHGGQTTRGTRDSFMQDRQDTFGGSAGSSRPDKRLSARKPPPFLARK